MFDVSVAKTAAAAWALVGRMILLPCAGLGLVTMVRNGLTLVGHGGLFTGHTAGLWFIPECDVTIALYLNRGFAGQRDLLDRVLALLVEGGGGFGACELGQGVIYYTIKTNACAHRPALGC